MATKDLYQLVKEKLDLTIRSYHGTDSSIFNYYMLNCQIRYSIYAEKSSLKDLLEMNTELDLFKQSMDSDIKYYRYCLNYDAEFADLDYGYGFLDSFNDFLAGMKK